MGLNELETFQLCTKAAHNIVIKSMHLWSETDPVRFLVLPLPSHKTLNNLSLNFSFSIYKMAIIFKLEAIVMISIIVCNPTMNILTHKYLCMPLITPME